MPLLPNAISGKGANPDAQAYAAGDDYHAYLHYSPYGFLQNWAEQSGIANWVESTGSLESVYSAETNLQRRTLAKWYGDATADPFSWPPHQVREDGRPASDLSGKYDSGWDIFNWGAGRITHRASHAFLNTGDAHAEKMLRFLAQRFKTVTGGSPAAIKRGYRMDAYLSGNPLGGGSAGWGSTELFHVGHAALAFMVDPVYQADLNNFAAYLAAMNTQTGDGRWLIGKAYYLMHLTGLMDYRINVSVPHDIIGVLYDDTL
jgi:hypothetical protein